MWARRAMPAEDHQQAVRQFYQEVINGRNLDALDELLTPDVVDHTFGSQNPEQAKQFFGMVHQALPDLHAEVHEVIAEGELVATGVTLHRHPPERVPRHPRDREEDHHQRVDFFRMQDGRQAEHWGGPDMFSFLMQLGVMPGPGTPGPGTPA
jgi:predicted SnoaL-like aldol condensation-catalyzing enzyme